MEIFVANYFGQEEVSFSFLYFQLGCFYWRLLRKDNTYFVLSSITVFINEAYLADCSYNKQSNTIDGKEENYTFFFVFQGKEAMFFI